MIQMEVIPGDQLRRDEALQRELAALAAPSYVDASAVLDREIAHCGALYTGRLPDGRLVCISASNREYVTLEDGAIPAVYMGLSAVDTAWSGLGSPGLLWRRCMKDVLAWQRMLDRKVVIWATCATPIVYFAFSRFDRCEPKPDGTYSAQGAAIATALGKSIKGSDHDTMAHPFVLKGVAAGTEYSESERQRIKDLCVRRGFTLFERLDVREERFDRIICLGYLPDHAERWFESPALEVATATRRNP